jgi:hypothetical protein
VSVGVDWWARPGGAPRFVPGPDVPAAESGPQP